LKQKKRATPKRRPFLFVETLCRAENFSLTPGFSRVRKEQAEKTV
jgi:hypothetical protein